MLTEAALIPLLSPFFDQESPQFAGFPVSQAAAAALWAEAAIRWASQVVPLSVALVPAETVFRETLEGALRQGRRSALSEAWGALARELAAGMTPAWVAVPPPVPLDLEPVFFRGEHGATNKECLEALAAAVTSWLRTGLATQAGTATTVNWS